MNNASGLRLNHFWTEEQFRSALDTPRRATYAMRGNGQREVIHLLPGKITISPKSIMSNNIIDIEVLDSDIISIEPVSSNSK